MSHNRATALLKRSGFGDDEASEQLTDLVYRELRGIAASFMRRERVDHTLQATDLVHEAYLRLIDVASIDREDRTHFLSIAAGTMRRVLVAHARTKNTLKRGAGWVQSPLRDSLAASGPPELDVLDLDSAITRLAAIDERKARVVELRFFAGLTNEDVAGLLEISPKTVEADWYAARAWLHRALNPGRSS